MMKKKFTLLCMLFLMVGSVKAQLEDIYTGLNSPWAVAIKGNDLYISEPFTGKILKLDLSSSNPTPVDILTGLSLPSALIIDGNDLIYAEANLRKISKIDLSESNPSPTEIITSSEFGTITGLEKGENILYITEEGDTKVFQVDISVSNPEVEEIVSGHKSYGIVKKGSDLYVAEFFENKISRIDLSQDPALVTDFVTMGLNAPIGLTLNGNFLYIADNDKITRADITQENPVLKEIATGLSQSRLAVFNGIDMYIAQWGGGGQIKKLTIDQPEFPNTFTFCDSDMANGLGGASPTGGVYSGTNVTDNGDGSTFTFNVATAGIGTHSITYTIAGETATAMLEVVASPTVSLSDQAGILIDAGVQTGLGGGLPTGGTYSGTGVTDDGNGMTFSFDPATAMLGATDVTYTYEDANSCGGTATSAITVSPNLPGNECATANDISALFGQAAGAAQTSMIFDNTNFTTSSAESEMDCFYQGDPYQKTIWYTFTGDGFTYNIKSVQCSATNYIPDGDTQATVYSSASGDCSDNTLVICEEDEDGAGGIFNFNVEALQTVDGQKYFMLVDGYNGIVGEYCLEVTRAAATNIKSINTTDIEIFPNPTSGILSLQNVQADQIDIMDNMGRVMMTFNQHTNQIDISNLSAGLYFLKIQAGEEVYSAKVVKQ